MDFKVRIVTKLAHYGIKIYIVMDSENYYVLKYIVFTGKATVYSSTNNTENKATMPAI